MCCQVLKYDFFFTLNSEYTVIRLNAGIPQEV